MKQVKYCRVCGTANLLKYLDLGFHPLANNFSTETYPVEVLFCTDCTLSQLSIVVAPELMYLDYPYHSGISQTFKKHCNDLAKSIKAQFDFKNSPPTCMDIASNDGCLLREFKKEGFVVRGYEPCKSMADKCYEDDLILVRPKFFTEEVSKSGRSWAGEDVITATNVFAHIDDLDDFILGVRYQQEKNTQGIFVIQVPHILSLIQNNQFDTIYHEHLSYFTFKAINQILLRYGYVVFRVDKTPIHGGSLTIYSSLGKKPIEKSVGDIYLEELSYRIYDFETYQTFAKKVEEVKDNFRTTLELLYYSGKKVMGYAASAKGISLLNYSGIKPEWILAIVDDTPQKQGKSTPGTFIPIVPFRWFEKEKPEYIVLLAWNFEAELRRNIREKSSISPKFIIPIPDVRIV